MPTYIAVAAILISTVPTLADAGADGIGPSAVELEQWQQLLSDDVPRSSVIFRLVYRKTVAPEIAALVIPYTGDSSKYVRYQAYTFLAKHVGHKAAAAGLRDSDPMVRGGVVERLADAGSLEPEIIEAVAALIGDPDATVAGRALIALIKHAPQRPKLRESIDAAIKSVHPELRSAGHRANAALVRSGGPHAGSAAAALAGLADPNADVRQAASREVHARVEAGTLAPTDVISVLRRDDIDAVDGAAWVLWKGGWSRRSVTDALQEKIRTLPADFDRKVARRCVEALCYSVPDFEMRRMMMREFLNHRCPAVRIEAARSSIEYLAHLSEESDRSVLALAEMLSDSDIAVAKEAAEKLGFLQLVAAPALEALMKKCRTGDPLRGPAAKVLGLVCPDTAVAKVVPRLVELLSDEDEDVREAAADGLEAMRGDAASAVAALAVGLRHPESEGLSYSCRQALVAIGKPAVAALTAALSDKKRRVRQEAFVGLMLIGSDAAGALPAMNAAVADEPEVGDLAEAMRSIDPQWGDKRLSQWKADIAAAKGERRAELLRGLGEWMRTGRVTNWLAELSRDPHPAVRETAVEFLGGTAKSSGLVPAAGLVDSIPALRAAMKDPEPTVRFAALRTLTSLPTDFLAGRSIPEISELLKNDPDESVRTAAAMAGTDFRDTVPALLAALSDAEPRVRAGAVRALGYMGPIARKTIRARLPLLRDPDAQVRTFALKGFLEDGNRGGNIAPEILPDLLALFEPVKDEDVDFPAALHVAAVSQVPGDPSISVPALLKLTAHRCAAVRIAACSELGEAAAVKAYFEREVAHTRQVPAIRAALIRAAGDESPKVRAAAVGALGRVDRSPDTVARLDQSLTDPDSEVRAAVCAALAAGAVPGPKAARGLVDAVLKEGSQAAAEALDRLHLATAADVPALIPLLTPENRASLAAIRVVGSVGPAAEGALPALRKLRRSVAHRDEVERAMTRIIHGVR